MPQWRALVLAAALAAVWTGDANAGWIVTLQGDATAPGSTGNFFDVVLTSDAGPTPTLPFALDSYNIELEVSPLSGITFQNVVVSAAPPDVFSGDGLGILITDLTPHRIGWNDAYGSAPAQIESGQSYGLGRVYYDVAGTAAPGSIAITLTPTTRLTDDSFNPVSVTLDPGAHLRVSGEGPVTPTPGPSGLVLVAPVALALLARCSFRLQKRRANKDLVRGL